jgi:hypothetical protein
MKKIYAILFASCLLFESATAQTVIPVGDELVLPQYAYYGGVRVVNRMPIACRLKLSGLTASATYRYVVGVSSINNKTNQAPGNMYRINNGMGGAAGNITGFATTKAINSTEINNDEMRTDNMSRHGRFTTDASGTYTGWFACVSVGNAIEQTIGSDAYFYVQVNDGGAGTVLAQSFRTTSTIKLLNYTNDATGCTALRSTSDVGGEKMVTIYDNTASTGRPLYCTFTENNQSGPSSLPLNEGTLWTNPVLYAAVDQVSGSWISIIPNTLSSGVRAIKFFNIDGTEIITSPSASSDGVWNSVSTVNPAGDSTAPVVLGAILLPVSLLNFSGEAAKDGVKLYWNTSQEINNKHFEISRAGSNGQFQNIGTVQAAATPGLTNQYSFTDPQPNVGKNFYQLKQVDKDGRSTVYKIITVNVTKQRLSFRLVSSGNAEIVVAIQANENSNGNIIYTDVQGSVLYKRTTSLQQGENIIRIPVAGNSRRMGIVSFLSANGERTNLKLLR